MLYTGHHKGGRHALAAVLAGIVALTAPAANAAELVMFTSPGCPWCAAWERDVGDAYAKTDLGQVAPLRRVNLHRDDTAGLDLDRTVRVTPTFVLARDGREVGRIAGYPGESHFWTRLERLIAQLKKQPPQNAKAEP
jgi:thioredoxin-related protein